MSLDLSFQFSVTESDRAPTGDVGGRLSFTLSRHGGWLVFNPRIAFFLIVLSSLAFNQSHFCLCAASHTKYYYPQLPERFF